MNITYPVTNNDSFCVANISCIKFADGLCSLPTIITVSISLHFSLLSSLLFCLSLLLLPCCLFCPFSCSTPFFYLSLQTYIAYRHLITHRSLASPSLNFYLKPWVIDQPSPIHHLPSQVHQPRLKAATNFYTLSPEHTHTHTPTNIDSPQMSYQHLCHYQEMFLPRIISQQPPAIFLNGSGW